MASNPRIQRDGSLLIEGQRTNLYPYSDMPTIRGMVLESGSYTLSAPHGLMAVWPVTKDWRYRWSAVLWVWLASVLPIWIGRRLALGALAVSGPKGFCIAVPTKVLCLISRRPLYVQLENGPFRSSYIQTHAVPVTREADMLSYPWPPKPPSRSPLEGPP